jgi:organic radical activating enzyme
VKTDIRFHTLEDKALSGLTQGYARPDILEIHPSPVCQLKCGYCHSMSSDLNETIYSSGQSLMKVDEYACLLAAFWDLGGTQLVVSGGGEPFLYPAIADVLALAKDIGFEIHVYTNGLTGKYFHKPALDRWLKCCASVRISLHNQAWREHKSQVVSATEACCTVRDQMLRGPRIHLGILTDGYTDDEFFSVLKSVRELAVDLIELRITLPSSPEAISRLAVLLALAKASLGPTSNVVARSLDKHIPEVPLKCFALHRNLVIDPYGGFRLCCMRAHFPKSDFSFIGSVRSTSLRTALVAGLEKMQLAGAGICETCSVRDAEFSEIARRFLEVRE